MSLVAIECFHCGVSINVTSTYHDNRQSDKGTFYCPNGHANGFPGESDAIKAERLGRVVNNLSETIDNLLIERVQQKDTIKKLRADARAAKKAAENPPA